MNPELLNSWKEIADYMNRGVRTVQRWETDLGLPVHRPPAGSNGGVKALKSDIDQWLAQTPLKGGDLPTAFRVSNRLTSLRAQCDQVRQRTQHAVELCNRACELVRNAQELSIRIAKDRASHAAAA